MTKFVSPILVFIATLTLGCGGIDHPSEALTTYSEAVRAKDSDAVYGMLDESTRMGLDAGDFASYFERNYDEILEEAEALDARNEEDAVQVEAELPVGYGRTAKMTYSDGRWRLADKQPMAYGQQTPRDAVVAFVTALDESNFHSVLALLSTDRRSIYVGELVALRKTIEQGLESGIVTRGNRAILALDGGGRIILVREGDAWKIREFQQNQ